MNIRMIPLFILENWMAANRVRGDLKFFYRNMAMFTIEEVREELAKRRE